MDWWMKIFSKIFFFSSCCKFSNVILRIVHYTQTFFLREIPCPVDNYKLVLMMMLGISKWLLHSFKSEFFINICCVKLSWFNHVNSSYTKHTFYYFILLYYQIKLGSSTLFFGWGGEKSLPISSALLGGPRPCYFRPSPNQRRGLSGLVSR